MFGDYYVLLFGGIIVAFSVVGSGVWFMGKGRTEKTAIKNLENELKEYDIQLGQQLNKDN